MPERMVIANMSVALANRELPTVTVWNRLEGRPRTAEFERSLAAEVRDPLWMITRQWQMGEFRGDDAGSPVFAKIQLETTRLDTFQPGRHAVRRFSDEEPLEAQVERRPLPFHAGAQPVALDLRVLMGRHWLKMLRQAVGDFALEYRQRYPVVLPDPDQETSGATRAHLEAWQVTAALAGRAMDGYALYRYLRADPAHHAYDGVAIPAPKQALVDAAAARFLAWFEALFFQPSAEESAWDPSHLEYQFGCAAPDGDRQKVYVAEEYYHGRLDWYSMDLDPKGRLEPAPSHPARPQPLGPRRPNPRTTRSFLPMPISYEGMPNTRWWAFEDRKTNLGQVDPSTTDLGALLFLEFGLVYANDWFLLPQPLPAGTIATVKGLAVTNVFGERIWIEPSGAGSDQDWQRWAMFVVAPRSGTGRVDPSLLVLPTVPKVQEGPPREDVAFVRDEMANMVWGVETTISLPTGMPKPGAEAAKETVHFHRRLVERLLGDGTLTSTPVDYLAPIRYQVMSTVPEQWIPFIPVHVDNDNRATQLQRAAMPRILEGDPRSPAKVEPRTALLREGLDQAQAAPYYVHEVEVTRAGTRVYQAFQRSRWYGGKAVTWLGVRKQTGRGSGSSQLRFDTLEDTGVAAEE